MKFQELINSFRKSVTSFGAKGISAGNTRIVKLFEFLFDQIERKEKEIMRNIDFSKQVSEARDYYLESLIKVQQEKIDNQNRALQSIAKSLSAIKGAQIESEES